jgi:hypothetical protein
MFVYVGGDWRRGFEYAWQTPEPEPDEGPGLTWRQLTPRNWLGIWDSKIRGHRQPRRRRLSRMPLLGGSARLAPITTVGRFVDRRRGDGRHRRDVGIPVTGGGSSAISTCPAQTGDEPYEAGGTGQLGARRADPSVLSERQRQRVTVSRLASPAASRDAWR